MNTEEIISVFLNPTQRFYSKERRFSDEVITTHFEDWEALSLLAGIINIPKARKIWYKYFDNIKLTEDDIKFAHKVSNDLKLKYNDEILNLLLSCPPKPFHINNAKELFSEMDLAKDKIENPAIRFLSSKDDKFLKVISKTSSSSTSEYDLIKDGKSNLYFVPENYKFSISFGVEKKNNQVVKRDTDILVLRNITTGKSLAHITRSGQFIQLRDAYVPKPVINLFFRVCSNPKAFILNYGLDSGNCSYCDRELTHPTSIKRNYGKKCAQDRSLPW